MRLLSVIVLTLGVVFSAQAQQTPPHPLQDCQALAPAGFPQSANSQLVGICRQAYVLAYDTRARATPWVVYNLRSEQTLACLPRQDQFQADQSLPPGGRGELTDYRRSGYDMGHLAPNGDMSWSDQVQRESFLLSNIAPQLPGLNRGLWRELESAVRAWAWSSRAGLTIYVGSVYAAGDPAIGSGVVVPRGFYKIVTDNATGETIAFLFPHQPNLPNDISGVQSTVADIESMTGIRFPVRDQHNLRRPIWPANTRGLLAARQAQCRQ